MSDTHNPPSVVRRADYKKEPYARISWKVLHDKRLNRNQKLVMVFLVGHGDGWVFDMKRLAAEIPMNEKTLRDTLDSLSKLGYVGRERMARNGGRFSPYAWFINEDP